MTLINCQEKLFELSKGVTLAAKAWGDESHPKILALHGWLDNAASFDFIAPLLAENFYVLAVDMIGHGKSSHRSSGIYAIWDYAREIYELIDSLEWNDFSVIGHSMGTTVGMVLSASIPKKINYFICVEGFGPITTAANLAAEQFAKALIETKKSSVIKREPIYKNQEEMIKVRMRGITGELSYEAAKSLVMHSSIAIDGGYTWLSDWRLKLPSLIRLTEEQCASFLQAINAPVLLILAEQGIFSGKLFDDQKYQNRRNYVSKLRVEKLPGKHHFHMEEQARDVARLCEDFLK